MILEKARKQVTMHSGFDDGYNQVACVLLPGGNTREFDLEKQWKIKYGISIKSAVKS